MTENIEDHTQAEEGEIPLEALYSEASQCCRLYSKLTMRVRTLAQQVVIAYAVGLGIFLSRSEWPPQLLQLALIGAGVILVLFALPLWALNQHYSSAFEGIRDGFLVPLESRRWPHTADERSLASGPWSAHARVRQGTGLRTRHTVLTRLAWHGPYVALLVIGVFSILAGALWRP